MGGEGTDVPRLWTIIKYYDVKATKAKLSTVLPLYADQSPVPD
jgi:hypothetical protein